jgi:hypothetical protein
VLLPRWGSATEVVGFVEQLTGDPNYHVVIRDNEAVPVSIFSEVLVGDVVSIPEGAEDVIIGLRLADGSLLILTESDGAVQLQSGAVVVTAQANVVHWMKDYLHSMHASQKVETVSLSTRGASTIPRPPKVLFTFAEELNYASAGRGVIQVEWVYGQPPFSLELIELESQSQVWATTGVNSGIFIACTERRVRPTTSQQFRVFKTLIPLTGVKAGIYQLSIADKFGNTTRRRFQFDKPFLDSVLEASQLVSQIDEGSSGILPMINSLRCDSIR